MVIAKTGSIINYREDIEIQHVNHRYPPFVQQTQPALMSNYRTHQSHVRENTDNTSLRPSSARSDALSQQRSPEIRSQNMRRQRRVRRLATPVYSEGRRREADERTPSERESVQYDDRNADRNSRSGRKKVERGNPKKKQSTKQQQQRPHDSLSENLDEVDEYEEDDLEQEEGTPQQSHRDQNKDTYNDETPRQQKALSAQRRHEDTPIQVKKQPPELDKLDENSVPCFVKPKMATTPVAADKNIVPLQEIARRKEAKKNKNKPKKSRL
eukprot:UN22315